jgi:hypothetical protein
MLPKKYIIGLLLQTIPLFLINLVAVISGLILVPIGLLFRYEDKSHKGDPSYPKWKMVKMPKMFHIWNNYEEGCIAKGEYLYLVGEDRESLFYMWWFLAVRNPANNLRTFNLFRCDSLNCEHVLYTSNFWFFIVSTDTTSKKEYYSFRYRKTHKNPEKGDLVVHIGYKVFPETLELIKNGKINKEDTILRYRGFATQFIPSRR